jgi:branched-chain amino acid transport system permease protein
LLLIIGGVVFIVFGGLPRFVDPPIQGTVRGFRGVVNVDVAKLVDGAAAIVLIAALFVWLRVAKSGQALRAVAQNELGAQLQGIRTGRIRTGGFALGVGLAAIAGGLIMSITSATPDMGNQILLNLFIMVILGGLDSVAGAVVGAFILAFMETVGVTYFGQFSILSVYGVVMLILIVRPEGILGHR